MNILITTVFEYPHVGGLSTHVQTLKDGLEQRGHYVEVYSFSNLPYWKRRYLVQGPSFLLNKVSPGRGFLYSHEKRRKMLEQYIKNHAKNFDIINAQDVYATLASIPSGIPTVSTVHGYMSFEAISKGTIVEKSPQDLEIQKIEKKAYQGTKQNITVDQRIKNYLKDAAEVEAVAIKNFINVDGFKPEKSRQEELKKEYGYQNQKVLFIPRRLTKKNGVIYPLMAMEDVLKEHPDTHLLYAGTGEEMDTLKQKAKELNIEKNIHLLGAVPHEKMKDYYAMCDVVVVPSVFDAGVEEATSISALEAMGSGSPLVASAIGGLKEIVEHEVDGILTEEKNTKELSEAINHLLSDTEYGKGLAEKARKKIEEQYSHRSASGRCIEGTS